MSRSCFPPSSQRWLLVALCCWGCGAPARVEIETPAPLPERFEGAGAQERDERTAEGAAEAGAAERGVLDPGSPWWLEWSAPSLNQLLDELFTQNLQLAQARARFLQLRGLSIQAGSERWPSLSLSASTSERKQLNSFGRAFSFGPPGSAPPSSFTLQTYSLSVAASYEIDVWGRIGAQVRASERDEEAAAAELRALAVTLSASLVELWLQLIELRENEQLLRAQVDRSRELLELTELRFEQGLRPAVDALQQRQQLAQLEAQQPPLQAQQGQLQRQLNALLGRYRGTIELPAALPTAPALPRLPVPAELLARRPDIQAARLRVAASDERVAAAFAARLPALRLSADVGFQAFEPAELLEDVIWGWAVNLSAPLFQAGRLEAAQRVREQQLREQLSAWGQLTIRAIHEVEDALANERALRAQSERIRERLEGANDLYALAERRYREGVGDLLTVLNASQNLSQTEQGLLAARRGSLSARVQLHRALGGSWSERVLGRQLEQEVARERREQEVARERQEEERE